MKVFRMDDYCWVASETIGQAIDFYLKETGCDFEDLEIKECDTEETESGMWMIIKDVPDGVDLRSKDEVVFNGKTYSLCDGEPAQMVSFEEAHSMIGVKLPYIISCVEV